jgi:translation elongation factor EF-Tu-like GTPase
MHAVAAWRFSVTETFVLSGHGPAVIGHIEAGTLYAGDAFQEEEEPRRRGIVRSIHGVRKADDRTAVGLIVDIDLRPGTTIVQRK